MRFSQHLVKDALERSALKLTVSALSIVSLTFAILLTLDLTKAPMVIERACETRLVETVSSSQTKEEVSTFVRDAIALRFNSAVERDPSAYMTQDLFVARSKEQEELRRGGIDQRLIVRQVKLERDKFSVEADRLVAVGKVRSAIPITLFVKVSSKDRSLTNPYGLVLTTVEQPKEEKKND